MAQGENTEQRAFWFGILGLITFCLVGGLAYMVIGAIK